jgi:hypothetical protein
VVYASCYQCIRGRPAARKSVTVRARGSTYMENPFCSWSTRVTRTTRMCGIVVVLISGQSMDGDDGRTRAVGRSGRPEIRVGRQAAKAKAMTQRRLRPIMSIERVAGSLRPGGQAPGAVVRALFCPRALMNKASAGACMQRQRTDAHVWQSVAGADLFPLPFA